MFTNIRRFAILAGLALCVCWGRPEVAHAQGLVSGSLVRGSWRGSLRVQQNTCDQSRANLRMAHSVLAQNGPATYISLEDRNMRVRYGSIMRFVQAVAVSPYIGRNAFSAVTVSNYTYSPGVYFLASYTYQNISGRRANVTVHYALRDANYNLLCQKIYNGQARRS